MLTIGIQSDKFSSDYTDDRGLAEAEKRREQKLEEDEKPIKADNDCGDACKI